MEFNNDKFLNLRQNFDDKCPIVETQHKTFQILVLNKNGCKIYETIVISSATVELA